MMDDVLIFGPYQELHDVKLNAVLQRIKSAGVTLYKDKSCFLRAV